MGASNDDNAVLAELQPVLDQLEPAELPAAVAALERMAAEHYRRWAQAADDPEVRALLQQGEDYENDNAAVLERLYDGIPEQQQALLERFPDLPQGFDRAFEGLGMAGQLAAQAAGEEVGAQIYEGFAQAYPDEAGQAELRRCAQQEHANAELLRKAANKLPPR